MSSVFTRLTEQLAERERARVRYMPHGRGCPVCWLARLSRWAAFRLDVALGWFRAHEWR